MNDPLNALLSRDAPEPSSSFDSSFQAALELERLLEQDQPEPSSSFDSSFQARLEVEQKLLRPRWGWSRERRWASIVASLTALAAAAALFLLPGQERPPEEDLPMLAHLELLEVYGEMELLDALEDPATFEAVAILDRLEVTP